jgi:hypothetical protein
MGNAGQVEKIDIMSGPVLIWSILPIAAYGAHYDARIKRTQDLVTQPQFLHYSWPELLYYHIRIGKHFKEYFLGLLLGKIQVYTPFIPINA